MFFKFFNSLNINIIGKFKYRIFFQTGGIKEGV